MQPTQTSTGEPVTVIAKVQQPPRPSSLSLSIQPATSYVVVDDQQLGPSRQMIYNPTSVHLHNRRRVTTTLQDYPVSLRLVQVCYSISRKTYHNHFHSINFNQHHHQCHLPLIMNSQDLPASPASTVTVGPNQRISPHTTHQPRPFSGPPESSKNNY